MKKDRVVFLNNVRRIGYYVSYFASYFFIPNSFLRWRIQFKINNFGDKQKEELKRRIYYYCDLPQGAKKKDASVLVKDFTYPWNKKHKYTQYFFDLYRSIRLFPSNFRFNYLFGDVAWEMEVPTLVKSRPIKQGSTNSVLCQLNRMRHFHFVNDKIPFRGKKDMLVFRGYLHEQPWRNEFLKLYYNHPMCNAGQTNIYPNPEWHKPFMSINDQLNYKFIACIEGNDVATNLKWVMSSNSIAVMPRPRIESWFMEGTLVPDYHYIEVKADYSDLIHKLEYYIAHSDKAEKIVRHAHEYVKRFMDSQFEECVQYLVVKRYFENA